MKSFEEWEASQTAETPLDTTGETEEGTRPILSFEEWEASQDTQPSIDPSTIPQPPVETPQEIPQETPQTVEEDSPSFYDRATSFVSDKVVPAAAQVLMPGLATAPQEIKDTMLDTPEDLSDTWSDETHSKMADVARTEALPVVGGLVGAALAPFTAGTSFWLSMAMVTAGTGIGAFAGESLEQGLKYEGYMDLGIGEEAPKDAWDIFNRSAVKAGEEAAWALFPDLLFRGIPLAQRKIWALGSTPTETITGEVVDVGRHNMVEMMTEYAEREGLDQNKVLLASDVAHVPLFKLAEDVTVNSYIGGGKAKAVTDVQTEVIQENITGLVGKYMDPAKGYVDNAANQALDKYIEPNMQSLNSLAVAGLINTGLTRASKAQESVAKSMYDTIGGLMEHTDTVRVVKKVDTGILGPDGNPYIILQDVFEQQLKYPVDLSEASKFAKKHLDTTLFKDDPTLTKLVGLEGTASYSQVNSYLIELKGRARALSKSNDELAKVRGRIINQAIDSLQPAADDALRRAEADGVLGSGGETLSDLKGQADAIWKSKTEDFQNSYISGILKQADHVNGAPDKLGSLFMKNEAAATKISKVLNDAKANLTGDALDNVLAAENAMKGSIIQDIFMPFDNISGKFIPPNVDVIHAKEDILKRLFSPEEFESIVKLSSVITHQSRQGVTNSLGFAQKARESGMILSGFKSLLKGNVAPILKEGGSTVLFALGMGRILTNPENLELAAKLADKTVPDHMKIQIMQKLAHLTYEYQKEKNAELTPDQLERLQAASDDREEAQRMYK